MWEGRSRRLFCSFRKAFDQYSFPAHSQVESSLSEEDRGTKTRGMTLDVMKPLFCSGRADVSRPSQSNSSAQMPREKDGNCRLIKNSPSRVAGKGIGNREQRGQWLPSHPLITAGALLPQRLCTCSSPCQEHFLQGPHLLQVLADTLFFSVLFCFLISVSAY